MDPQIEKLLKLPTRQKVALLVLVLILECAAIFYLLYQPRMKEHAGLQSRVEDLQKQIQENRRIANNLPRFKAEYEQLKKDLDAALTELPNQKEIPSLLTSISSVGRSAGLDFLLFRPKPEVPKDFYAEVPVDIAVSGTFYNVADFFVAVGSLPRIVNINNVSFSDIKANGARNTLKVNCLATTFRFLDKKEIKDEKKSSTRYAASLLLMAALLGCSKKEEPPPAPAPKPVQPAKPVAKPVAPVQKQLSSAAKSGNALDFRKRTDPFKPYAPVVAAPPPTAQPGPRPSRSSAELLPIQTFEVSKFKVAGIIAGLQENWALLIDPNGKGYTVQQGMLIGNNDGRITRITASTVEVVENFREDNGRIKKRKIVLTLAKKR